VQIAKQSRREVRDKGEKHQRQQAKRRQNREPRGRGGQGPQREERGDGCVTLLGRSHQGRPEAKDTLTMISHALEISIAEGGADEKDKRGRGLSFSFFFFFFLFFLYHIFFVKVQEIAWSASYRENKTQNPKGTNKGNIRHQSLQLGSVPVPGPRAGTTLKQVR